MKRFCYFCGSELIKDATSNSWVKIEVCTKEDCNCKVVTKAGDMSPDTITVSKG